MILCWIWMLILILFHKVNKSSFLFVDLMIFYWAVILYKWQMNHNLSKVSTNEKLDKFKWLFPENSNFIEKSPENEHLYTVVINSLLIKCVYQLLLSTACWNPQFSALKRWKMNVLHFSYTLIIMLSGVFSLCVRDKVENADAFSN